MSISNYYENVLLDRIDTLANRYLKLHSGDPGEACTSNPYGDTLRKAVTFAAAASGSKASNSNPTWASLTAAGDITHWSMWDDVAAGNAIWNGAFTNPRVGMLVGDAFDIPTGTLILTLD